MGEGPVVAESAQGDRETTVVLVGRWSVGKRGEGMMTTATATSLVFVGKKWC